MTDKFTVYLVDDDAGVRKALSRLLRAKGYEVQSHVSAQEFLERHDPAAPGCAVLDVAMPDLDGLGLVGGTDLYARYHHLLLHNWLGALLTTLGAAAS